MAVPTRRMVEILRKEYPEGTRIFLLEMDDPHAPPVETKGTVKGVDDMGDILVAWDNGSSLNVVYGIDKIRKCEPVTTVCDHQEKQWEDRLDAQKFFLNAAKHSVGRKQECYTRIFLQLYEGKKVATDEE